MTGCYDCKNFRVYSGSHDRFGVPQEPDDYECIGLPTEEEIDKYFCDGVEWRDSDDGCSGFELRDFDYED